MPATKERWRTYSSVSDESTSDHNHRPQQNINGINFFLTQTRHHSQFFLRSQINVSKTFGPPAKQILDSFLYTKLQAQLKRSINLTYLENGTYNEILAHLDRELKMSCLETIAEVRIPTMTTTTTTVKKTNSIRKCRTAANYLPILWRTRTFY